VGQLTTRSATKRSTRTTQVPGKAPGAAGREADLTPVTVVLPPARHRHVNEPMIGGGDPLGVPGREWSTWPGPPNGGFAVDDPLVAIEGAQPGSEGGFVGEPVESARSVRVPALNASISPATTFPRNTRLSAVMVELIHQHRDTYGVEPICSVVIGAVEPIADSATSHRRRHTRPASSARSDINLTVLDRQRSE
jgi:hypothetical protein